MSSIRLQEMASDNADDDVAAIGLPVDDVELAGSYRTANYAKQSMRFKNPAFSGTSFSRGHEHLYDRS